MDLTFQRRGGRTSRHHYTGAKRMSQSEQKSISAHVDALVDQALALSRQQQQKEQQHQEQLTRKSNQQTIAVFQALLATEIEADLQAALSITFEVRKDSNSTAHAEAVFCYEGIDWSISQEYLSRSPENWRWSIRTKIHNYSYQANHSAFNAAPQTLRETLLLKMGEHRELIHKKAMEAAEHEREQQRAREKAKESEERETLERAERIAQADQEHASLVQQFRTLKQQAIEQLWCWPDGVRVAIYRLTYNIGVNREEDGDPVVEQESGWTSTDQLDAQGYIRLEPAASSWREAEPREIKLSYAIHMPVWERKSVSSVEELPRELRRGITISFPGVVERRDRDLDAKPRLTTIKDEAYDCDESPFSEHIAEVPLPWVQALVDQVTPNLL